MRNIKNKEKSVTIHITKSPIKDGSFCIYCKEWKFEFYTNKPEHEAYELIKEIIDSEYFDE
jgi:hypothetical protein